MQKGCRAAAVAVVLTLFFAPGAGAKQRAADRLDVYTATVSAKQLSDLQAKGLDVEGEKQTAGGIQAQLILTRSQKSQVEAQGIKTELTRVKGGKTVKQFAA